ncbi:MAG: putative exported protein [Herminiimonas sp.]|nr:putative exported protein [Herminiimonas sp.]
MSRYSKLSLLAVALGAAGSVAYAAKTIENDAAAIAKARISLVQAVTAAEQHVNGKAAKAEFEHSKQHGWVYDIEVVSGSKVFDVKIDPEKGAVIASTEDKADHDDGRDEQD